MSRETSEATVHSGKSVQQAVGVIHSGGIADQESTMSTFVSVLLHVIGFLAVLVGVASSLLAVIDWVRTNHVPPKLLGAFVSAVLVVATIVGVFQVTATPSSGHPTLGSTAPTNSSPMATGTKL